MRAVACSLEAIRASSMPSQTQAVEAARVKEDQSRLPKTNRKPNLWWLPRRQRYPLRGAIRGLCTQGPALEPPFTATQAITTGQNLVSDSGAKIW